MTEPLEGRENKLEAIAGKLLTGGDAWHNHHEHVQYGRDLHGL
jgi:hypothetical protein